MKNLWKNVLVIVVVAASAIVLYRLFFVDEREIKETLDKLKRAKAQVDSLEAVNARIQGHLDSLQRENAIYVERIEALKQKTKQQEAHIRDIAGRIYEYKGSPDSLHRELNQLIKTQLPPLPD